MSNHKILSCLPTVTGFDGQIILSFHELDENGKVIPIKISPGEALQLCAALATAARQAIKDVL